MSEWLSLDTANKEPGHAETVELLMKDGTVKIGHYAYGDGDGLMPPFRGWFERVGAGPSSYFAEIHPIKWRPVEK